MCSFENPSEYIDVLSKDTYIRLQNITYNFNKGCSKAQDLEDKMNRQLRLLNETCPFTMENSEEMIRVSSILVKTKHVFGDLRDFLVLCIERMNTAKAFMYDGYVLDAIEYVHEIEQILDDFNTILNENAQRLEHSNLYIRKILSINSNTVS